MPDSRVLASIIRLSLIGGKIHLAKGAMIQEVRALSVSGNEAHEILLNKGVYLQCGASAYIW